MEANISNLKSTISSAQKQGSATASAPHGPAASDLLTAPLTRALAQLNVDDKEEGRPLRPETYAQSDIKGKNRDYLKMDTVDLLFGWVSVADFLLKSGGDLASYIQHIKFAAGMLHSRRFYDVGAIEYDRYIVNKFLRNKSGGFAPDPVILSHLTTYYPRFYSIVPLSVTHKGDSQLSSK